MSTAMITITAAVELIRFVMQSRDLKDKTPEEIIELWGKSQTETQNAINAWNSARAATKR